MQGSSKDDAFSASKTLERRGGLCNTLHARRTRTKENRDLRCFKENQAMLELLANHLLKTLDIRYLEKNQVVFPIMCNNYPALCYGINKVNFSAFCQNLVMLYGS
jgi:hypothetical protein